MVKRLIAPLQKVLLQKKLCPGCTMPLKKAVVKEVKSNGTEVVVCECTRIFIYDKGFASYRRALPEEVNVSL